MYENTHVWEYPLSFKVLGMGKRIFHHPQKCIRFCAKWLGPRLGVRWGAGNVQQTFPEMRFMEIWHTGLWDLSFVWMGCATFGGGPTLTTFLNNKLVFWGLCLLSFGLVWVVAWSQTKSVLRLPSWSWLSALEKDRSVPLSFKVLGMGKRIFWAHGMYGNNLPKSVLISFD